MADWLDDDWEDESLAANKPKAAAAASYVPNSWDDEDASDEEVPAEKAVPKSVPMKPSKARALAMQERERKEMEAAKQKRKEREARLAEMSSMERKLEQQRIVEAADLDNAKDLFSMDGADLKGAQEGVVTLDTIEPKTDAEYTKLADMIGEKCRKLNTNPKRTLRYVNFVKEVIRNITRDLNPDDAKDLNQFTGLLSNEKLDAFKKSKGHKKKNTSKKSHVKVDRADDMDDGQFDNFDEYDGFM